MKKRILVLIFNLILVSAFSQKFELGSWNILNAKYNLNNKWSFFGEAQVRSLKFYNNFHYHEVKGGFNFKPLKNLTLSLGAGNYQTYKEGGDFVLPKNNNELRIWPQVILSQTVGQIKIEQRYRSEFRFTSNGYRNRFRYRLGLIYSFGKEKNAFQPFQFNLSNEIFFTDFEPYFERNRILAAFSYKPNETILLQIGYLHQFDYKINDETGRDFLQIGCFFEFFSKKTQSKKTEIEIKDN